MAAVTAASVYGTYQQGKNQEAAAKKQYKAAQDAANQQKVLADQAANADAQAQNRANQRSANAGGILDQASAAAKGGASGTLLTGAQGIDPNALSLGKNTLLGG
jgi:hypothetical protein